MGDGELDEGNIWEAAMLAGKYKLQQYYWYSRPQQHPNRRPDRKSYAAGEFAQQWEAFGWHVIEIDGNNIQEVIDACNMAKAIVEKPVVILAHTVPGKGVDFMEYDFHWHGVPPNHDQAVIALKELRTLGGKIRSEHE
jgi:transketolase